MARPAGVSVDIGYLIDPTRSLDLRDILGAAPDRFRHSERSDLNFGYTHDAVWLKVTVTAERDRAMLLSLSPNYVDLIDIYMAPHHAERRPEEFRHVMAGDHRPLLWDGFSGLSDVVELNLKAGEPVVAYIRLAAISSGLTTNVQVYSKGRQPAYEAMSMLLIGTWFGAAAVLVVIQLAFYYYDRQPQYLLLAFSIFMVFAVHSGVLGLSHVFLFPEGGMGNDIFLSVSIWLGLTASALATASILELRQNCPWLHRIFLAGAGIGLIGTGFGVAGLHILFIPFGNLVGSGLATLAALQAVRTMRWGETATGLRAAAYVVLWIGVVTVMALRSDVISWPIWLAHVYEVACVLQVILLTAAFSVRLRAAEALNGTMQEQALVAARAAEEHATRLVQEKTSELAAARQRAEDALKAELRSQEQQVRFMEVISHQYRTPLTAVRTYIDNIGLSLPKNDEGNRGRLDRMRNSIQRLVEVLEVNLTRSRLQGSSFRPDPKWIPVAEIIEAAAARGRDLLQSAILTDLSKEVANVHVEADADMLGIAIINLLENAEKFSRAHSREPVTLSCRVDGDSVVIAVRDHGIGIPAKDLPAIFDLARRGENTQGIEGTGMGLSLVARIAAAHGGAVHAESVEGQGTTVTINLPISGG